LLGAHDLRAACSTVVGVGVNSSIDEGEILPISVVGWLILRGSLLHPLLYHVLLDILM
jgi:hypothetical protein